jgi:23S rRNA (uracil1939-C5)-methyltransferase
MQATKRQVAEGERITLGLTSWGRLGEAMAHEGGRDVFVFGGIPGERVIAEVARVRRKYVGARVVEVLEPSEHRVEPPCPYYGDCTGCQWQHFSYPAQLVAKRDKVVDALIRVGGFTGPPVSEVIPSPQEYGYRNHARFTVGRAGALGFVNRETRRFNRIDQCMLMHSGVNHILAQLQGNCGETTQLSIRSGKETGDFLVQPPMLGRSISVPTGQKSYLDSVDGKSFRVSSPSFFQVNIEQAAEVVRVLRRWLGLNPEQVLLDAYAGVGTFAILLAPYVKKVIAVEESSAAVADAKENTASIGNVEFALGKTEDVLGWLAEKPDVVILDPPRAGCQPQALHSLIKLAPPRVTYVSCDAETLARDLRLLCEGPYTLERVIPLDMFPQTHHVECVALLSYDGPGVQLVLASASPRRRELLSAMGLPFRAAPANINEELHDGETPGAAVARLSLDKALAAATNLDTGYVIGADSLVVLNGQAMGKPADAAEAGRMLRELRGTRHQVTTGVTVVDAALGRRLTGGMTTDITLRNFTDAEIEASISSGTPMDKAGAYAVQDPVLHPAESWEGCYANIVGLPVCRVVEMLEELGCALPPRWAMPAPEACGPVCPLRLRRSS